MCSVENDRPEEKVDGRSNKIYGEGIFGVSVVLMLFRWPKADAKGYERLQGVQSV